MVRNHVLHLLGVEERSLRPKRFRIDHFMDQDIGTLREVNEIFRITCISRKDDRVSAKINTVSQRRLDHAMINRKRGHLHAIAFVNNTFADIFGHNLHGRAGKLFIHVAPDVYIEFISLSEVRHHVFRAWRSPDPERHFPSANPAGQPHVRNSNRVVRMQVSEK